MNAGPPQGAQTRSEAFSTKAQAAAWAQEIEAEMDARRFNGTRGLANITLKDRIDSSTLSAPPQGGASGMTIGIDLSHETVMPPKTPPQQS